jgi:hypothetical protein
MGSRESNPVPSHSAVRPRAEAPAEAAGKAWSSWTFSTKLSPVRLGLGTEFQMLAQTQAERK